VTTGQQRQVGSQVVLGKTLHAPLISSDTRLKFRRGRR